MLLSDYRRQRLSTASRKLARLGSTALASDLEAIRAILREEAAIRWWVWRQATDEASTADDLRGLTRELRESLEQQARRDPKSPL